MREKKTDIQDIFHKALSLSDTQERMAFLSSACGSDAALRQQLDGLLNAASEMGDFLGDVTQEAPTLANSRIRIPTEAESKDLPEKPGTVIGRYKLLQQIGEGGFGVVYMAEQEEPVRRRVALKIIKLGMDTKQVIARFEAERQALAMMDHPNIARVFDAGASETGRPFFVMELVQGISITKYCDMQQLPLRERLQLFRTVCTAVQHAHQKGVIHRDLKPGNILVSQHDGVAVPKVIDFGIAKATEQRLTERTMFTEFGQFVGTPAYMSPEQADSRSFDIDTRSDIYSLGVLLYELVTGTTPFSMKTLRGAGISEIQRIIREEEPAKPSTRLSTLGDDLAKVAKRRGLASKRLGTILRGDLDWIILKAMSKDRNRRYATANAFVQDIDRHLQCEPVHAGPPSSVYRMTRFVRRHRTTFTAGSMVLAAIIVGLIFSVVGFLEARQQHQLALRAFENEQTARSQSQTVTTFLTEMLTAVDPRQDGIDITVREVLDKAGKDIDGRFDGQPLVEAELRHALSATYWSLGIPKQAETHALRALELRRETLGPTHPQTVEALSGYASTAFEQGRYEIAEKLHRQALVIRAELLGKDHPQYLDNLGSLGASYERSGRYAMAEALWKEALDGWSNIRGEENMHTLMAMNNYGQLLNVIGRYRAATPLLEKCLELRKRVLDDRHPHILTSMNNLALLRKNLGHYEEAVQLYEETWARSRRVLGETHLSNSRVLNNLANTYIKLEQFDKAAQRLELALDIQRRHTSEDHDNTIKIRANLATLWVRQGRFDEAEDALADCLSRIVRINGEEHPQALRILEQQIAMYELADVKDKRREVTARMVAICKRIADRPTATARHLARAAQLLLNCGIASLEDPHLALRYAQRTIDKNTQPSADHLIVLANAYRRTGNEAAAQTALRQAGSMIPTGQPKIDEYIQKQIAQFDSGTTKAVQEQN